MPMTDFNAQPKTAAEWFAARKGARDDALERRFTAWLTANTSNFEDYALCELTWELAGSAAADLRQAPVRWYRIALATTAAAVVLAVAIFGIRSHAPHASVWSTGAGEQRLVSLADGSRITLNTRSAIEVRVGWRSRSVTLVHGEAFFEVAQDPSRPFIVATAFGSVQAVGTRFDVMLDERHVEVSMQDGKVLVRSSTPGAPAIAAVAGDRATLSAGAMLPAVDSADLTRVENWRAHRIEFDRVPLAAAMKEFSRYTAVPIRVESPDVGRMSISALLRTGDINALRATLNGAFGLRIEDRQDELVITAPAP